MGLDPPHVETMHSIPQSGPHPAGVPQGDVIDLVGESFTIPRPWIESPRAATLTADGSLTIGHFKIPTERLSARLRDAGRLTEKVARLFPSIGALERALRKDSVQVPSASIDFARAFETFNRAMEGSLRGFHFMDTARAVDRLSVKQEISSSFLGELRNTLIDAARVATVCAAIDQTYFGTMSYRSPLERAKDWLIDRSRNLKIRDPRIRARLTPAVFEELCPTVLRVDADLWAQRIALSDDGSPEVRRICASEHHVADLLSQGIFERSVSLVRGGMEGQLRVGSESAPASLFSAEFRIESVFAALQLGRSASRLLTQLEKQKIDLVRMCRFVDREAALGVKTNLERVSPEMHARLDDIDEWGPRFEAHESYPLSREERHELAAILLDAEICLYIAGHMQNVVSGSDKRSFWGSLWSASLSDKEVLCGMNFAHNLPAPLDSDCHGAGNVVTNAALMLGFSNEDRSRGAAWRIPENPLASLTWAMTRAGMRPMD